MPEPLVFRGVGARRATRNVLVSLALYGLLVAGLAAIGVTVRTAAGWFLVAAPTLVLPALRLMLLSRVSAALDPQTLRYEGSRPASDFEVPRAAIRDARFEDRPARRLVLVLDGGAERRLDELGPRPAEALREALLRGTAGAEVSPPRGGS